jgi:glycosyltransferase involved in cell wall biosynthesis
MSLGSSGPTSTPARPGPTVEQVTAVVPVRNAEGMLPGCLESLRLNGLDRVIVVDGESTDSSREIARTAGAALYSDRGDGLPAARTIGAGAADTDWVVLVDSDVRFPDGSLAALLEEFSAGGYSALQAGLESVAGPGYWGQALAHHHRTGRSRSWFGLVATVVERRLLLDIGFDAAFKSGEDIELRWRMTSAGLKVGVSEQVMVEHRFAGDDLRFALDQFSMDGRGLGLMIRKHGWRGLRLALLPAAAAARGTVLSLVRREPRWIPYYLTYCAGNYVGMAQGLVR